MKKLFLLFCFLQITSLAFCKHVIFDLKMLLQNKGLLSSDIEKVVKSKADFLARQIYGQVPGFNLDACALELASEYNININHLRLFDACSQKSQELFKRDFIKEFFTGKITAQAISEFIQEHRDDIYSLVPEGDNIFLGPLDKKALDLVAEMLLSMNMIGHCYGSNLCYLDFMKENVQASLILKHLKGANQGIYLISNMPREWYGAYKIKFNNIFNSFGENNTTFSFQLGFKKSEENFFKAFLEKYNLNSKDCILIGDSDENLEAAMYLGFKTILFDPKNPKSVIEALRGEGALDREQSYFIPEW